MSILLNFDCMVEHIIKQISDAYELYKCRNSSVMFNFNTQHIMDFVLSFECCSSILNDIARQFPVNDKDLEKYSLTEYFCYIHKYAEKIDQLVAFYYQWYLYEMKTDKDYCDPLYNRCSWLWHNNDISDEKKMSLFKSDFVAVLIDFVKVKLQDRHIVLYFLNRFKQREERFHSLIHYEKDDKILEKDLQKRLYLYLFDQGFELYNESDTANGKMDFHLTGRCSFISGTTPFIIEVKVMKSQSKADAKWLHQLEIYSKQTNIQNRCLVVFTDQDVDIINNIDDTPIISVYIGSLPPSKRKKESINISHL